MKKRIADIIMDTLADNGIEQAFCVVGGGSMYLNNALGISKRIKPIFNHHEQACAMAAEGYARYMMNKPALVCVTGGPGGTNALTGVMGAYVDSIPMIVISGQCRYSTTVEASGLPLRCRGIQEFNIVDTVKTMTKYAKMIVNPLEIKREVQKAYDIAMNGRRGPVWLDIPLDIQQTVVNEADLLPVLPALKGILPDSNEVQSVMDLLKRAERPVILAGAGVRSSDSYEKFLDFLERVQIPVVTASAQPDVLYREHPMFVGACGPCGQRAGNFVLQNADVVLVIGAELTFVETGWVQENFAPRAHIVMVNVDEFEPQKPGLRINKFLHADLSCFFEAIKDEFLKASKEWLEYKEKVSALFDPFEGKTAEENCRVNTYTFWEKYAQKAKADAITCLGNSSSISGWLRYGNKTEKQRSFVNVNCGSMGDDITLAEGVVAAAKRSAVVVTGDGSIMMNIQELATIRHNMLPVKIVLFSNDGYGALRNTFKNYFQGVNVGCDANSGISFPDFEKIAKAFGFPYYHCHTNKELDSAIEWLFAQPAFAFLEIDENFEKPRLPCVISKLNEDGSSEPALLQDMSPFIDRDEYKKLMISEKEERN